MPHGSILGPFLFNTNVNDLENVNRNAKYVMYAYDKCIVFPGETKRNISCERKFRSSGRVVEIKLHINKPF